MPIRILHISFLVVIFMTSCVSKTDELIAIDVLLTLPPKVKTQAIEMNQKILSKHPDNFTLDNDHIPHITLLQCYILESDLPKIKNSLQDLYQTIAEDTFQLENLQYKTDQEQSFASLGIRKNESLMTLHHEVVERIKPFAKTDGGQEAYIQNPDNSPIDQFTIDYVPKFINEHSFENYNPHISLGVANTALLDSLSSHYLKPSQFQSPTMSIYQLGAFGTAQKILWESK